MIKYISNLKYIFRILSFKNENRYWSSKDVWERGIVAKLIAVKFVILGKVREGYCHEFEKYSKEYTISTWNWRDAEKCGGPANCWDELAISKTHIYHYTNGF